MDDAVKIKKLSLSYKIPPKGGIKNYALKLIKKEPLFDRHYILKDISFTVKKSSAIALIGDKGAGKTALLKLIAGIMTPTSGQITTNGCISPIFSRDLPFNPSLTVKNNVYFVGELYGFSNKYMKKQLKNIIEFAELNEQLNAPVKKCTQEMLSRLAFSIAAFIKTDILIVDEALSVCDKVFCKKCIEKMSEMKLNGTSIFFVSDSIEQIKQLCEKSLWLDGGEVKMFDETESVIKAINNFYEISN